jgi:LmbE family N-acetylglucosaminyl deacetylase
MDAERADRRRTVLAVFAHPDDESLACGGTLARLAAEGCHVVLICASHGERGGETGPVRNDALGLTRAQEVLGAAAALGVQEVILLDHPDGDLRWSRVAEFHADLVSAISRYSPAAVITFGEDGLYWHLDHVGVYERTTTAVASLGAAAPPLYYVTMPRGIMRSIVNAGLARGWKPPVKGFWSLVPDAFGLQAEPPTIVIDVSGSIGRKLDAIGHHRTQMGPGPLQLITDAEARSWLGIEQFHRATVGGPGRLLEQLGRDVVPAER